MLALGNATFACGVRSARERPLEEASGETEVGTRLLTPEPRPLPPLAPRTRPAGTQTEPQVEPATSAGVILPETGHFCFYARYSCGNNCNVVVKLVQECKFFLRILLPFYGNSSPGTTHFLGKRRVTSELSR